MPGLMQGLVTDEPRLGGWRRGAGEPVLLLHGGPGLDLDYLEGLAHELEDGYDVVGHQQRGLEPSSTEGPFAVADHVDDVRRVLDALGWERAHVVGHSWGGHLALHVAVALPDRTHSVLVVDPLGAVGDGGAAAFEAELAARTPSADLARIAELDTLAERGEATPDEVLESFRLIWPAYFSERAAAPPMPTFRFSMDCYAETNASISAELPALERALPGIGAPVGFVHGERSPMPVTSSSDTADRIPGAWVDVVAGSGHFIWLEAPGAVRRALDRLTRRGT